MPSVDSARELLRVAAEGALGAPALLVRVKRSSVGDEDVLRVAAASPRVRAVTVLDGGCYGGECEMLSCDYLTSGDAVRLAEALARSDTIILVVASSDCAAQYIPAILEVDGDPRVVAGEITEALRGRPDVESVEDAGWLLRVMARYALAALPSPARASS